MLRRGHGLYTPEQFAQALANGEVQILQLDHGSALVAWMHTDVGLTLCVLTMACEKRNAVSVITCIEKFARAAGARAIQAIAREGWASTVRPLGYRVEKCVYLHKLLPAPVLQ